jgi:hypothetical protein
LDFELSAEKRNPLTNAHKTETFASVAFFAYLLRVKADAVVLISNQKTKTGTFSSKGLSINKGYILLLAPRPAGKARATRSGPAGPAIPGSMYVSIASGLAGLNNL